MKLLYLYIAMYFNFFIVNLKLTDLKESETQIMWSLVLQHTENIISGKYVESAKLIPSRKQFWYLCYTRLTMECPTKLCSYLKAFQKSFDSLFMKYVLILTCIEANMKIGAVCINGLNVSYIEFQIKNAIYLIFLQIRICI